MLARDLPAYLQARTDVIVFDVSDRQATKPQKFAVGKIPSFAILAEPLQGKLLAASLVGWLPC
jgi:hypothetical protein